MKKMILVISLFFFLFFPQGQVSTSSFLKCSGKNIPEDLKFLLQTKGPEFCNELFMVLYNLGVDFVRKEKKEGWNNYIKYVSFFDGNKKSFKDFQKNKPSIFAYFVFAGWSSLSMTEINMTPQNHPLIRVLICKYAPIGSVDRALYDFLKIKYNTVNPWALDDADLVYALGKCPKVLKKVLRFELKNRTLSNSQKKEIKKSFLRKVKSLAKSGFKTLPQGFSNFNLEELKAIYLSKGDVVRLRKTYFYNGEKVTRIINIHISKETRYSPWFKKFAYLQNITVSAGYMNMNDVGTQEFYAALFSLNLIRQQVISGVVFNASFTIGPHAQLVGGDLSFSPAGSLNFVLNMDKFARDNIWSRLELLRVFAQLDLYSCTVGLQVGIHPKWFPDYHFLLKGYVRFIFGVIALPGGGIGIQDRTRFILNWIKTPAGRLYFLKYVAKIFPKNKKELLTSSRYKFIRDRVQFFNKASRFISKNPLNTNEQMIIMYNILRYAWYERERDAIAYLGAVKNKEKKEKLVKGVLSWMNSTKKIPLSSKYNKSLAALGFFADVFPVGISLVSIKIADWATFYAQRSREMFQGAVLDNFYNQYTANFGPGDTLIKWYDKRYKKYRTTPVYLADQVINKKDRRTKPVKQRDVLSYLTRNNLFFYQKKGFSGVFRIVSPSRANLTEITLGNAIKENGVYKIKKYYSDLVWNKKFYKTKISYLRIYIATTKKGGSRYATSFIAAIDTDH